jgi:hypothetical protein
MPANNQPEPEPNPERDPSRDIYSLWHKRALESLPYNEVRDGLATYLHTFYKFVWDAVSPWKGNHKDPWYLGRDRGLWAWCRWEAKARLDREYRESYSILEFYKLHFREDLRRDGIKAIQNNFWTPLIIMAQKAGDSEFLKQISVLVNQPETPMHQGMRCFCMGWDRQLLPLEFWSYPAIADWLVTKLANQAPTADTIKHWAHRLGLKQASPVVVPHWDKEGPVIDGEALEFHKIPDPE